MTLNLVNELAERGISLKQEKKIKILFDCEAMAYEEEVDVLRFIRDEKVIEETTLFIATETSVMIAIKSFYERLKNEL